MAKLSEYLKKAYNERMEGGAPIPIGTSKELSKGAGQSGSTENFQIEYINGAFYKLVGNAKEKFTPNETLMSKILAALAAKGMKLPDIAKDSLPIDFQVLSSGQVILKQTTPE